MISAEKQKHHYTTAHYSKQKALNSDILGIIERLIQYVCNSRIWRIGSGNFPGEKSGFLEGRRRDPGVINLSLRTNRWPRGCQVGAKTPHDSFGMFDL